MAEGKSNTKKIAFVVTVLVVLIAIYWFVIRPKLKAKGMLLPKDPTIAAARAQYEKDMLRWIKSDDPSGKAWYQDMILRYNADNPNSPITLNPDLTYSKQVPEENLLGSIRAAASEQAGEYIHTIDGILQWRGPVKTLYGF